ncbi:unnamed protein product [Blepharisma stoltei]|uniref:tRNA-binding domain-containing protein n=1 Tax=Blepharisma stoltei TaxID=1481888 RepID=A0AAU9IHB6_9CILI|nr:unnamed protein product [Blepharisma stoltei]
MLRTKRLLDLLIKRLENNLAFSTNHTVSTSETKKTDPPSIDEMFLQIDIRVGRIIECWKHPESESLYCEKIDIGEGEPREIGSGLQKHVPLESMSGLVLVVANLKPRKLAGFLSNGMVLAVSQENKVDLLRPPQTAITGERIGIFGLKDPVQELILPTLNPKKKIMESCLPWLKTDSEGYACFGDKKLLTSQGPIVSPFKNSQIS